MFPIRQKESMNELPQEQQELYRQTINELSAVWAKNLPTMYPDTAFLALTTFSAATANVTVKAIGEINFNSKNFGTLIADMYEELKLATTQKTAIV